MDPQNTGSFGSNLGGISALKQAMARRGLDASILDQVSAAAPGEQAAPSAVPQDAQQVSPDIQAASQSAVAKPTRSGEMEIALKALADTVKTENTLAKQALKLTNPQPGLV